MSSDLNGCPLSSSTGLFRSRSKAAKHLDAAASHVIISAPGESKEGEAPDYTVVLGINDKSLDPKRTCAAPAPPTPT